MVPARNEAATVGDVVARVRSALMETTELLDEIVVIDSDSTDETHSVATAAGAVVHRSREIRPDLGTHPGKGEAMWKSLFVTRGDLIVFMDADLVDWDTHFVPGLLGPLLADDGVALVKGFYERPLRDDAGNESAFEGGRVTELVARPLIALEWPELAWLVQPLAGEWSVRRDLFSRLSVPTGYAVELAALIDTLPPPRPGRDRPGRPRPSRPPPPGAARPRCDGHPDPGRLPPPIHRRGPRDRRPRPAPPRPAGSATLETVRHEIPLLERPPAAGLS